MNRLKVTLLCLCMSIRVVLCSSQELHEDHFLELISDDALEKAFGRNPQLEEPPALLTNTIQILSLANELLSEHKPVTLKTETQAAHFTSTALTKKNEKEEDQATLSAQVAIYETQIERSIHLKETIEREISQYTKLIEENEKALKQITLLEEKARKELRRLDCVDGPPALREIAQKLVEEYGAARELKESEKEGYHLQKKRLSAALKALEITLAELIVHKRAAAHELSTVNTIIAQLDTTIKKTDEKFMISSPLVSKEER